MLKKMFGAFLLPLFAYGEIVEIHAMGEARDYFEGASSETLGVFDVDETLIVLKEPLFHATVMNEHKSLVRSLISGLSSDQTMAVMNAPFTHYPETLLLDEETPHILAELADRGVPLLALTGSASSVGHLRHEELQKHGIDFSKGFPHLEGTLLTDLKMNVGTYPLLHRGILSVNGFEKNTKGEVLLKFLERACVNFRQVIFVDDRLDHLQNVEKSLQEAHPEIKYVGLHYHGSKKVTTIQMDAVQIEEGWKKLIALALEEK